MMKTHIKWSHTVFIHASRFLTAINTKLTHSLSVSQIVSSIAILISQGNCTIFRESAGKIKIEVVHAFSSVF